MDNFNGAQIEEEFRTPYFITCAQIARIRKLLYLRGMTEKELLSLIGELHLSRLTYVTAGIVIRDLEKGGI